MLNHQWGGPAKTTVLEELIYMGGKFFVLVGGVGVLDENIEKGGIIIPNGAIRDEGTSYHYYPPKKKMKPTRFLTEKLKNVCKGYEINFYEGKVWSTDAPYRETPARIKEFRKRGAICVEMEASPCYAVANYRNIELTSVFLGGDLVREDCWSLRKEGIEKFKDSQEKLFYIVCKTLKEASCEM